jgi:hypothetical protein
MINIIHEPPAFQPVLTNGLFYTVSADTTNKFKFRYTYDLYVNDEVVFQGKSTPNPSDLGVIDVSRILKTYVENNPIAVWNTTNIYTHQTFPFSRPYSDETIPYQMYFGFEYSSTELGSVTGFTGLSGLTGMTEGNPAVPSSKRKTFASTMGVNGRATQQDFNVGPFVLSGTPTGTNPTTSGLFLTNSPRIRNIQDTEYYTLSFTNYYLDNTVISEPYYVQYEFFDEQGTSLTAVTFDNITTNGGGPRTNCLDVYPALPIIIPSGETTYNTLYVGAGPKNLEAIMPVNTDYYTVQLFGKFTGSTSPIQPSPTPTPTPSSTPAACACQGYQVTNPSLIALGILNYLNCDNVLTGLVVNPGESYFVCMCQLNAYAVVLGELTVTYDTSCIIPPTPSATPGLSPTPTPTRTPTPTPTPTFTQWTTQYCAASCLGGLVTCTAASGQTLYTAPGVIITDATADVFTNSSLTTPYVGFFRYGNNIYYSDGTSVTYEGEIGDPC